jgi:hypothetical protein
VGAHIGGVVPALSFSVKIINASIPGRTGNAAMEPALPSAQAGA